MENIPVLEFSEKEIELINALKEKGVCPETQALFCAWQDAEQARPEWKDEKELAGKYYRFILQARLEARKAKILMEAALMKDASDADQAASYQVEQVEQMIGKDIDKEEFYRLIEISKPLGHPSL